MTLLSDAQVAIRTDNFLKKYTAQIKLKVLTANLSDITVYDIPHPTSIKTISDTHSVVIWHIKGYIKGYRSMQWYNDIVTKISLCLDAESLIENVNKELTTPVNNRIYELKDFNSVDDQRYWKSKKIYLSSNMIVKGDYQSSVIRYVAYTLARQNILTKDLLTQESLNALNNTIEKRWFKYQINAVYEWTQENYTGRTPRQSEGTRTERAIKNSKKMSDDNYLKIEKQSFLSVAMGLKPSNNKIIKSTGLSKNTVKKHLRTLLKKWGQSIGTIRGKSISSSYLAALRDTKQVSENKYLVVNRDCYEYILTSMNTS